MKFTPIILGCLISFHVCAANKVYKCVDATGKKEYQSRPCEQGLINSTLNVSTGSSVNLDEEKKQQELKEKEAQAKQLQEKRIAREKAERQLRINKEAIAESANNQTLVKSDPKKYAPFAIPPYDPNDLSVLVKNYQDRLADIERLRRAAAAKALASNECERVEESNLSDKSAKDALIFLVSCSTGKTFTFTEQELKN